MDTRDSIWAQPGATLSDKSARQEFGLTQQEIIAAIRTGKLQFRQNSMHGNPWFRLLRHEVEALVRDKSGQDDLHKKKLQKELADLNKEARKLTTRLKAIERRRVELVQELDGKTGPLRQTIAKSKPKENPFAGRWRIISMSAWEQAYIDEEEEGYFEFNHKGWGEFHFGCVHGQLSGKLTKRDGEPAVEWTWDGSDEMDPAQGRGWAIVKGDELHGMIFFHGGDDSEFVAKQAKAKPGKKGK